MTKSADLCALVMVILCMNGCDGGDQAVPQTTAPSISAEHELISTSSNKLVENYYIWFKGADLSEASLGRFAIEFRAANCTKDCNLWIYDKKLDEALVTRYPLRGAEYVEVADHLVAQETFDSPGEIWMWSLKNETATYEEAKRIAESTN